MFCALSWHVICDWRYCGSGTRQAAHRLDQGLRVLWHPLPQLVPIRLQRVGACATGSAADAKSSAGTQQRSATAGSPRSTAAAAAAAKLRRRRSILQLAVRWADLHLYHPASRLAGRRAQSGKKCAPLRARWKAGLRHGPVETKMGRVLAAIRPPPNPAAMEPTDTSRFWPVIEPSGQSAPNRTHQSQYYEVRIAYVSPPHRSSRRSSSVGCSWKVLRQYRRAAEASAHCNASSAAIHVTFDNSKTLRAKTSFLWQRTA